MGIIYKATNTSNSKCYIGKTKSNLEFRKEQHFKDSFVKKSKLIFHCAIRKYGIESFVWEILEECDDKILNEREIYYIDYYKSNCGKFPETGYNMTNGGDGGYILEHHPNKKEIYAKMAKSNSGENNFLNKMSYEDRENWLNENRRGINCYAYGKKFTEERRKKMSEAMRGEKNYFYGKKHTDEARKKMSTNSKGKNSGEKNPNYKKTGEKSHVSKKYVITTKSGFEFYIHGIDEFCNWYKETFNIILQPQNISTTAKGKNKQHKGLIVRFYDLEKDKDVKYWKDVLETIKEKNCEN